MQVCTKRCPLLIVTFFYFSNGHFYYLITAMIYYLILILLLLTPVSANPLSLQEALEKAKSGNFQIKAEKEKVERAKSEKNEARARFMPTVSLSASVTRIDDPIYIDLNQIRSGMIGVHGAEAYQSYYNEYYKEFYNNFTASGMSEAEATARADAAGKQAGTNAQEKTESSLNEQLPSFEKQVQDDLFFNARLSVVWPIFTGLKILSAYDAAKENIDAKKAEFDMAQNTILMDVATKYFTLRLTEELIVLRETTKKNLEEHLDRSKKLEEGGQISKAERLRAEVALAEAEDALSDAKRDESLARMVLASLLQTDTNLVAVTPVDVPVQMRSKDEYKQLALEKHPGLRQLQTERKRSKNAISAARADYFPTVALFGYKELYTKDLTILEPEWAIGAKVQMDLFKGGDTRAKVNNAKSLDRSLASLEKQTMDNISLLAEKKWRELEHAQSRLESLNKTKELAEESLRSQKMAYESGLATSLDVVDAELALLRLKMADLKAHYDAVIAWLGLLEISGEVSDAGIILEKK